MYFIHGIVLFSFEVCFLLRAKQLKITSLLLCVGMDNRFGSLFLARLPFIAACKNRGLVAFLLLSLFAVQRW
jgi:hypothetical protein